MPPTGVTVAVPLVPPLQETGVVFVVPVRADAGCPTDILFIVLVQELASVIVTL